LPNKSEKCRIKSRFEIPGKRTEKEKEKKKKRKNGDSEQLFSYQAILFVMGAEKV